MYEMTVFSGGVEGPYIDLRIRRFDDTTVMKTSGDVDVCTSHVLRENLLRAVDFGSSRMVLDLSNLGFIDSSCFSALAECYRRSRLCGCEFSISCENDRIRKLFEIAGMDELLEPPGGRSREEKGAGAAAL